MTIDVLGLKVASAASAAARISAAPASSTTASIPAVDANAMSDAAQAIQQHLSGAADPPQFSVDYLSGLDVMTVRQSNSGEVLFQIPGPAAIRLAQLLKEGTSVEWFGIVDQTA